MTSLKFGSRILFELPANHMSAQGAVQGTKMDFAELVLFNDKLADIAPEDVFQLAARKDQAEGPTRLEVICPDKHDDTLIEAVQSHLQKYKFLFENKVAPDVTPQKLAPCRDEQEQMQAMHDSQKQMRQNLDTLQETPEFRYRPEAYSETLSEIQRQPDGKLFYTLSQQETKSYNSF